MKEFIEYLVKQIVKSPDEVKVEEIIEDTVVTVTICAAKEDMGIIIGKEGRTINSLRALAKAKAIKEGVKVYIQIC